MNRADPKEGRGMPALDDRYDVVVAGARAAGASTAMLLARRGMRVLVVDPARRGSDTLSTHALMRAGVLQLHRWGLLERLRAAGTPRIESTSFHYGAEAITVAIGPRDGVDGLYAPRRTVLDPILVEGAIESGARVEHGISVAGLLHDRDGRVRGVRLASPDGGAREVAADLVVGADGLRSRVASWAGAETTATEPHTSGSIYGYVPDLGDTATHWHYGDRLAMGRIPTDGGDTCVFASVRPEVLRSEGGRGLESLFLEVVGTLAPELADAIVARGVPKLRAFPGSASFLRRPWGPGWALVGDAGYFRDPLTAHGITDAFIDAELLADAAAAGGDADFDAYRRARDARAAGMMRVTGRIAAMDWTLEEVQSLHKELSREMSAEVEAIVQADLAGVA